MKYVIFLNFILFAYSVYFIAASKGEKMVRNIWAVAAATNGLAVLLGLIAYTNLAA